MSIIGAVNTVIDYRSPGPLTDLGSVEAAVLVTVGQDPVEICDLAHTLVIQPCDAESLGLPSERFMTNQTRPAARLIEALLAMDPAPVTSPRKPDMRVVGTCRHFAVISCALLRHRGIPARVRCGFATYFQTGRGLDHWITEYRDDASGRWVRIDSEVLGAEILDHPDDLRPGEFLSGGEAWTAFRGGDLDASTFGVYGTNNWGAAEIRGNTVKDLAALNKVETLPWDEWGRMTAAYSGETGPDYDELLDSVAGVCASDDSLAVSGLYKNQDLRVPDDLIR